MSATFASDRQGELFAEVLSRLEALGYKGPLLPRDYEFPDWFLPDRPLRVAPAAAFARTPQAYDSACFAVLLPNSKRGAELVADYRCLGAPFAFEVQEDSVAYWEVGRDISRTKRELVIRPDEMAQVFDEYDTRWTALNVLRIKNLAPTLGPRQGELDLGLIPALQAEIQHRLDALLRDVLLETKASSPTTSPKDLFRLVFRFLAAKILHDRGHKPFSTLSDFSDTDGVLNMVGQYYGEPTKALASLDARRVIAQHLWSHVDFRNLSVEVLAYIYENTLVDPEVRQTWGTHSTPHNVARYIVYHLPFERISQDEPLIVEPFSGAGIFLFAALQRLRDLMLNTPNETERHSHFTRRLCGYEVDAFATEVSKVLLTLADFPNHNGWQLHNEDLFLSKHFVADLSRAGVVLCNPPFEDFNDNQRAKYKLRSLHKPEEVMHRVLDAIPRASVLGFVLPYPFLDGANYRSIRERLVDRFDEIETVGLPDGVFRESQQTSALLIAKTPRRQARPLVSVTYTQVADKDRAWFLSEYGYTRRDTEVKSTDAARDSLKVVALREIWHQLERNQKLSEIASDIHRGVEWVQSLDESQYVSMVAKSGFERGFHKVQGIQCFEAPRSVFLCTKPEYRRGKGVWGLPWQRPKVLLNASRISRSQWCLAAFEDKTQAIASQNFHAVWLNNHWTTQTLAAVLNGPIANAFMSVSESEQQRSRKNRLKQIPMPDLSPSDVETIDALVDRYIRLIRPVPSSPFDSVPDTSFSFYLTSQSASLFLKNREPFARARDALLEIDATILRAYGLPPRMERELLDFFRNATPPRPVPFALDEYFPESFGPTIPLWMYISRDLQRCTAEFFLKHAPDIDDPALVEVLKEV